VNIVMISPGYPVEMAYFTRALAAVGATVIGVGDQPPSALPEAARNALAHYEHVALSDEDAVLGALHGLAQHVSIDQVECLWEPYMILAARIRESFWVPGMTVEQTVPFRDKEQMKQAIDAAGIRTPWHVSTTTVAAVWEAAERVGYPLIVKPIAGAGSADTYRVDSAQELTEVLPLLRHVPEVSVEEFVDGEEFTYDTVCAGGSILFENIMCCAPCRQATGRSLGCSPSRR
jgi:formate-dependent phosphoribosylglycinamide formyltransferase (GAR transformylase)